MYVCEFVISCVWLFATPKTVAHQSMEFFQARILEMVAIFLLQGFLPKPGIEPTSLVSFALAGGFFTTSTTWETRYDNVCEAKSSFSQHSLNSYYPHIHKFSLILLSLSLLTLLLFSHFTQANSIKFSKSDSPNISDAKAILSVSL